MFEDSFVQMFQQYPEEVADKKINPLLHRVVKKARYIKDLRALSYGICVFWKRQNIPKVLIFQALHLYSSTLCKRGFLRKCPLG